MVKQQINQKSKEIIAQEKKLSERIQKTEQIGTWWEEQQAWHTKIQDAPVYYVQKDELDKPLQFISKIQKDASKFGICKIILPVQAGCPANMVLDEKIFKFATRVQMITSSMLQTFNDSKYYESNKPQSLKEFRQRANEKYCKRFGSSTAIDPKFIEGSYWYEMEQKSGNKMQVEYGNDLEGTGFSNHSWDKLSSSNWNLKKLPALSQSLMQHLDFEIPGINLPMLYIGMLYSTFAWHVEDHNLYSINYHHYGQPKVWYGVPSDQAQQFEQVVKDVIYKDAINDARRSGKSKEEIDAVAYKTLLGKNTMFSPQWLIERGVRVYRIIQHAGEFVVTFAKAFHAGFSTGYNCGEAVNFAPIDWVNYGEECRERYRKARYNPLIPHEQLICLAALNMKGELLSIENKKSQIGQLESNSFNAATIDKVYNMVKETKRFRLYNLQIFKQYFVRMMKSKVYNLQKMSSMGVKFNERQEDLGGCLNCEHCLESCYIDYCRHRERDQVLCIRCAMKQIDSQNQVADSDSTNSYVSSNQNIKSYSVFLGSKFKDLVEILIKLYNLEDKKGDKKVEEKKEMDKQNVSMNQMHYPFNSFKEISKSNQEDMYPQNANNSNENSNSNNSNNISTDEKRESDQTQVFLPEQDSLGGILQNKSTIVEDDDIKQVRPKRPYNRLKISRSMVKKDPQIQKKVLAISKAKLRSSGQQISNVENALMNQNYYSKEQMYETHAQSQAHHNNNSDLSKRPYYVQQAQVQKNPSYNQKGFLQQHSIQNPDLHRNKHQQVSQEERLFLKQQYERQRQIQQEDFLQQQQREQQQLKQIELQQRQQQQEEYKIYLQERKSQEQSQAYMQNQYQRYAQQGQSPHQLTQKELYYQEQRYRQQSQMRRYQEPNQVLPLNETARPQQNSAFQQHSSPHGQEQAASYQQRPTAQYQIEQKRVVRQQLSYNQQGTGSQQELYQDQPNTYQIDQSHDPTWQRPYLQEQQQQVNQQQLNQQQQQQQQQYNTDKQPYTQQQQDNYHTQEMEQVQSQKRILQQGQQQTPYYQTPRKQAYQQVIEYQPKLTYTPKSPQPTRSMPEHSKQLEVYNRPPLNGSQIHNMADMQNFSKQSIEKYSQESLQQMKSQSVLQQQQQQQQQYQQQGTSSYPQGVGLKTEEEYQLKPSNGGGIEYPSVKNLKSFTEKPFLASQPQPSLQKRKDFEGYHNANVYNQLPDQAQGLQHGMDYQATKSARLSDSQGDKMMRSHFRGPVYNHNQNIDTSNQQQYYERSPNGSLGQEMMQSRDQLVMHQQQQQFVSPNQGRQESQVWLDQPQNCSNYSRQMRAAGEYQIASHGQMQQYESPETVSVYQSQHQVQIPENRFQQQGQSQYLQQQDRYLGVQSSGYDQNMDISYNQKAQQYTQQGYNYSNNSDKRTYYSGDKNCGGVEISQQ